MIDPEQRRESEPFDEPGCIDTASDPAARREAAEARYLEVQLVEVVGGQSAPDMRHRVLAASGRRGRVARGGHAANSWRTSGLAAAIVVLMGIAAIITLFLIQLGSGNREPEPGRSREPNRGQVQDKQQPEQPDRLIPARTLEEFRRHVRQAHKISIVALSTMRHNVTLGRGAGVAETLTDASAVKRIRSGLLKVRKPAPRAGWNRRNEVRLFRKDGSYVSCSVRVAGPPCLRIHGLGDFIMEADLIAELRSVITSVDLRARLPEGIVFGPEDLLRRDGARIPAGIRQLLCRGLADDDLRLLRPFSALRELNLIGCARTLKGPGLASLVDLPDLAKIDLSFTRIDDAGLARLGAHKGLRELELRNAANITGEGFARFRGSGLRGLTLAHCYGLTETGLRHIAGLGHLQRLDLTGYRDLTDASLARLGTLRELRELRLKNTTIRGEGLARFSGSALRRLDLGYCRKLTDAAMEHVAGLQNLESLDLTGCSSLTATAVQKLRAALPDCSVQVPRHLR